MVDTYLPGAELIHQGLADLAAGSVTTESLLVSIAAPGLRELGFDVGPAIMNAELELFHLMSLRHGSAAHSRYNALVRRVVSFRRAAQCAR